MTKTPEELTADWKAEKLRDGLYYILLENQKTPTAELETWYKNNIEDSKEYYETEQVFYEYPNNIIREILAPVPPYEELQKIKSENERLRFTLGEQSDKIATLMDTNASLKYLLKECKEHLENAKPALWNFPETERLLTRINTAIGESEEK